jgi:hypothetical protein
MSFTQVGGIGFLINVKQMGSDWVWEIKRFKAQLGSGVAKTEKAAKDQAWTKFREVTEKGQTDRNSRGVWRLKLRDMVLRRPYMVAHVAGYLNAGSSTRKLILDGAAEGEAAWAENDPVETRYKWPLHKASMLPVVAAEKILNAMVGCGLVKEEDGELLATNKLRKWAGETLGETFTNA